jgi:tRNA (adenine22-N1)-methyltransferase
MLSPRLAAVLAMIGSGCRVLADIGTDHARLSITAVQTNTAQRAIACDIASGPLARAAANITEANLTERIQARLGNGFDPLDANEADTAVIAGMGGMNIIGILERGGEKAESCKKIILQPQHDIPKLRINLHRMGYTINDERIAREGGRFYIIIHTTKSHAAANPAPWSERDYYLGKYVKHSPDIKEYISMEISRISKYITSGTSEKRAEHEKRLKWLNEAMILGE